MIKIEELNPEESSPSLSNNPLVTEYSYEVFGALKQVTQGSQTRTFTCATSFDCFDVEDGDYPYWIARTWTDHGIQLPWDVFGFQFVDCGGGDNCLSVEYLDRTSNSEFFDRWLDGSLPERIYYGEDDPKTEDMADSFVVRRAIGRYVEQACPATWGTDSGHFPAWFESAERFLIGTWNPTQAQVGGWIMSMTRGTRNSVTYRITNTANSSFNARAALWGRLTGNRYGSDNPNGRYGPRHNVTQVFEWTETNPCLW